jgi:hypothetical protein
MSGANSSFLDSSFDYRSLLPTTLRQDDNGFDQDANTDNDDGCSCLPEMTWRERILGCATCMIAGYLLSFGSFWRIKDLVIHHDPLPFVLNATVGNLIALAGSFFLTGPLAQFRNMWQEKRRTATALYVGSLFLTLVVAFSPVPGPKGLYLLILMLVQYVSITWYCLSYIPFAQDMLTGFLRRRLGSGG